jgi:20S proteasome alpha/beta subunit
VKNWHQAGSSTPNTPPTVAMFLIYRPAIRLNANLLIYNHLKFSNTIIYFTKVKDAPMIRPQPKLIVKRRTPVTFVVGMMCSNGMVLCTDSLESDGFTKKAVGKIRTMGTTDWQIAIAGAGAAGLVDKFSDEVYASTQGKAYDVQLMESTIEDILQRFELRYSQQQFQVVIALHSVSVMSKKLYRSEGGVLVPKRDFTHTGVGHELWRFLSANLFEHGNSVNDNKRLAVFATRQAINYLDGVEGPIQLATYTMGDQSWVFRSSGTIGEMEKELHYHELGDSIHDYWARNNPPSHREQVCTYKGVKSPGDELTHLEGVKVEALQTVSGRKRAAKIFDRNRDRIGKRAKLEWERTSGRKGS